MSKVKSPQDKKRLSLENDRRNTWGENQKSSRKNIPRAKQRQHRDERRSVAEVLRNLKATDDEDIAVDAELLVKTKIAQSRGLGFKKRPDVPLIEVLVRKGKRKR